MADQEELTPEEKLLRVIQKGEPSAPAAETAAGGGVVAPEADAPPDATAIASGIPPAGRGLVLLNRALAAAAALFLLLAVHETYLNMPANATVYPAEPLDLGETSTTIPAASLSDTLDMFARRRIFGQVPRPLETIQVLTNTVSLIGWRAYARDNLTLMGMSDIKRMQNGTEQTVREAIVMDNKYKKMLFLREGSLLTLADQEVTVASVGETFVELKMGDEILKVE